MVCQLASRQYQLPGRIGNTVFCSKFFIAKCKISLTDLANERQLVHESLSNYVNRLKNNVLDWNEIIAEKELIRFCINGMQLEYKVHIENHTTSEFAALMNKVEITESTVIAM